MAYFCMNVYCRTMHRSIARSIDRGSNGIGVYRLSNGRELMIGHPRVTSNLVRARQRVGVRNPVAQISARVSESRCSGRTKWSEAHRSHPRKLSRPPLMRGFDRHTSKVIAYLRDQVRPPRRSLNSSLPYRRAGMGSATKRKETRALPFAK